MKDNWLALIISILTPASPDQAMEAIHAGRIRWGKVDDKQMQRLKEKGFTYQQVGDIYGLNADAVCSRIRRLKSKIA